MKLFVLIPLLLIQLTSSFGDKTASQWISEGIEMENRGEAEQALNHWMLAYSSLEEPSLELAHEFLRVTTETELTQYYEVATTLFYWGLTSEDVQANRVGLEKEVGYIKPLISDRDHRNMMRLIRDDDPQIFQELQIFWDTQNPVVFTRTNERLIEHWLRISYSRQNFTRNKNSVYDADPRSEIYVKYGEPGRTHSGLLEYSELGLYFEDYNLFDCRGMNVKSYVIGTPEYEIWVYDNIETRSPRELVFIFGTKANNGPFSRIASVGDFVNPMLFRAGCSGNRGAMMLEMYTRQLSSYHSDFFMANNRIMQKLDDPISPIDYDFAVVERGQQEVALNQLQRSVDPLISEYQKEDFSIPVEAYVYRLLDENNRPQLAVFLESKPQIALFNDLVQNQDIMFEDDIPVEDSEAVAEIFDFYRLDHGLQIRNNERRLITQTRHRPVMLLDFQEQDTRSSSVFIIPNLSADTQMIFNAELKNGYPGTKPAVSLTAFSNEIRGIGKLEMNQPEPLTTVPGELAVSDLILGIEKRDVIEEGQLFPFVVINNRELPAGDAFVVHFEIYNLTPGSDNLTTFDVEYNLTQINWIGMRRTRDQISSTLNFQHDDTRFIESLEIQSADLTPGSYELSLVIKDNNSEKSVTRSLRFDVKE
jgi:GWxTD domain-containing protein